MDGHYDSSLIDALLSGFINKNDNADAAYEPMLIANHDGRTMERAIKDELQRSQDFDMSVAFVSQGALQALKQYFLDFADNNNHQTGRIITSTFNYFNSPKAFKELLKLQEETGITVQVWQPEQSGQHVDGAAVTADYPYHPKGYVFRHAQGDEPLYSTYIGSSNLTINALNVNREWNLKVAATNSSGLAEQLSDEIESQISESKPLTDAWLKLYEEDFKKYAPPKQPKRQRPEQSQIIQPNAMQVEALMNLAQLRRQGESRAIIISATGTGKTYLSAFDVRQVKPNRMLYIAQQEQILRKAEESFQKVLGCPDSELGLFSGTSKESDRKYVFATVQTMSRPEVLAQFGTNDFDYILVDEVHHAAADSYKRIIDHFEPEFMLGMTATPERPYRTKAITGENSQTERDEAVEQLERGDLDYIFTVDLFNEGVDIPHVNQIVMLRQTKSSIIFTQQLGRGLRKASGKDCVVVIDFIGNYTNNYLIPIALYGNTGDRDVARKNLQRETIGISSISFDKISRERVLASLDTADLSNMKLLSRQYQQMRYELGRIPMLMDFARRDASLVFTLASKNDDYLSFARSREKSLSRGKNATVSYIEQLEPTSDAQHGVLKMLTSTQLRGLRPHELLVLAALCDVDWRHIDPDCSDDALTVFHNIASRHAITVDGLRTLLMMFFPDADRSGLQCRSAFATLDYSYFIAANAKRFGQTPLVRPCDDGSYRLTAEFSSMLGQATFRTFFTDTIEAGLFNAMALTKTARKHRIQQNHGFLYGEKYTVFDVMRLCGWAAEQVPQNVGGYRLDADTGSLPIFIKYEASQYGDRFLNPSEIEWFSKNNRSLTSNEFRWLLNGTEHTPEWQNRHFVPVFIRRKAEEQEKSYYFVGSAVALDDVRESVNRSEDGRESKVVVSTLKLIKPVDPELYRHLTGKSAL